MIVFESMILPLTFLHLVCAVVALSTSIHLVVRLVLGYWGEEKQWLKARWHGMILAVSYVSTYALGSAIYPAFRVHTRAAFLDEVFPHATGLFEIKEHGATLALLPALALGLLVFRLDHASLTRRRTFAPILCLAVLVSAVLVFNACAGWYIRGIEVP